MLLQCHDYIDKISVYPNSYVHIRGYTCSMFSFVYIILWYNWEDGIKEISLHKSADIILLTPTHGYR